MPKPAASNKENKENKENIAIGVFNFVGSIFLIAVIRDIYLFGWNLWIVWDGLFSFWFFFYGHKTARDRALGLELESKIKLLEHESDDTPGFNLYSIADLNKLLKGEKTQSDILQLMIENIDKNTYINSLPCHTCAHYNKGSEPRCAVKPTGTALDCQFYQRLDKGTESQVPR